MEKYIYKAKLDRVIDGDTVDALIDVGFNIWFKKRIRFKGLDTWESRTRNLEEKKRGLAAKERTKPGFFRIRSYGTGKYGRVLAELFVKDTDGKEWNINQTLIDEGHAYQYDGGKKRTFRKIEKITKEYLGE